MTFPRIASAVDCAIQLASGISITGHRSHVRPEVCEFLGIPYGLTTAGDRRFAPPQPAILQGDFIADRFGPDCPQNPPKLFAYPNATPQYARVFSNFVSTTSTNHTQSEDCLTLNIWMKASANHTKRPILVWIHGGRHNSGSSNTPFYNGANFVARENAVVVTFNFRMNIFGFPGSPEATQNLGFLDQYLAVQWVSDNIASFGADPQRISLYGQSSGAVAVSNWAYAFKKKPLVTGTASHSGNHLSFPASSPEQAAIHWYKVSAAVGCGSSGNNLACMRGTNITFQAILDAVKLVPSVPGNSEARAQPSFQATVDGKTFWSTANYLEKARAGDFAPLPFLQIHGDHESGFYRISALAQGNTLSEDEWQRFERESFTCASAAEAYYRGKHNTTTYRFRYMADWPNTRLYESPTSGAYHGADVNLVTGNSGIVSGIEPEERQVRLGRTMASAWAMFAADSENALTQNLGWPRYGSTRESLVRIGAVNANAIEFVDQALYDGRCATDNLSYWDANIH